MPSVDIRVELPSYAHSFQVHVPSDSTFRDVKSEIMRTCPGGPRPDGQRLVWRGRFLKDDEKLDAIWQSPDDTRIVHLAVHPSAWSSAPPTLAASPALSAPAPLHNTPPPIPRSQPIPQVQPVHSQLPSSGVSPLTYIHHKHSIAIGVLMSGTLPPTSSAVDLDMWRSFAVNALQSQGLSWPHILDEDYPPPSSGSGVKYERVVLENQAYLSLMTPAAIPTSIQAHALKVLSYTLPLLSLPGLEPSSPWALLPYTVNFPPSSHAHGNQQFPQFGPLPLRFAVNQNPNQNPVDPNVPGPAQGEIRAIPLRALMLPLIMLTFRTALLMYFFLPTKRPVFGLFLTAWALYEAWGAVRAAMGAGRDRGVVRPGNAPAVAGQAPNAQPGQQAQGRPVLPGRATPDGPGRSQLDVILDHFSNLNLTTEETVLNVEEAEVPAPPLTSGHRIKTFLALILLTLHPAAWDRRRTALRRREGRLRAETNARVTSREGRSPEENVAIPQGTTRLAERHEQRPVWVREYVERVQTTEWVDDT